MGGGAVDIFVFSQVRLESSDTFPTPSPIESAVDPLDPFPFPFPFLGAP